MKPKNMYLSPQHDKKETSRVIMSVKKTRVRIIKRISAVQIKKRINFAIKYAPVKRNNGIEAKKAATSVGFTTPGWRTFFPKKL